MLILWLKRHPGNGTQCMATTFSLWRLPCHPPPPPRQSNFLPAYRSNADFMATACQGAPVLRRRSARAFPVQVKPPKGTAYLVPTDGLPLSSLNARLEYLGHVLSNAEPEATKDLVVHLGKVGVPACLAAHKSVPLPQGVTWCSHHSEGSLSGWLVLRPGGGGPEGGWVGLSGFPWISGKVQVPSAALLGGWVGVALRHSVTEGGAATL